MYTTNMIVLLTPRFAVICHPCTREEGRREAFALARSGTLLPFILAADRPRTNNPAKIDLWEIEA